MQYGHYVERVLNAPTLPRRPTSVLRLSRVALSVWDAPLSSSLRRAAGNSPSVKPYSTSRCVLAVFQRGKQIWSQAASALVGALNPNLCAHSLSMEM